MGASISNPQAQRPTSRQGQRPRHPQVAAIEGLVEALVCIKDVADRARAHVILLSRALHTVATVEADVRSGAWPADRAVDDLARIGRLIVSVSFEELHEATTLAKRTLPELRTCYQDAEFARA